MERRTSYSFIAADVQANGIDRIDMSAPEQKPVFGLSTEGPSVGPIKPAESSSHFCCLTNYIHINVKVLVSRYSITQDFNSRNEK